LEPKTVLQATFPSANADLPGHYRPMITVWSAFERVTGLMAAAQPWSTTVIGVVWQ
jgi:hypothetical protein